MELIGPSTFFSGSNVTEVPLPVPEGAQDGDQLLAIVIGPPQQPITPWVPLYSGWYHMDDALHMSRFFMDTGAGRKVRLGRSRTSDAWTFLPSTGKATSVAAYMFAIRGGKAADWKTAVSCQNKGDKVCFGFKGNEPNPACKNGCNSVIAPAIEALDGELGLYVWASHDEAAPLVVPGVITTLRNDTAGDLTVVVGTMPLQAGINPPQPAQPRPLSSWSHGLAGVVVLG